MSDKFDENYLELAIIIIIILYLIHFSNNIAFASNSSSLSKQSLINQSQITKAGINVDSFPVGVAVNPFTNKIYVTNEYSNSVSVINGDNDKVEDNIVVGSLPYDLDVDPFTNKVYVANLGSDYVSIIDAETNKVVANINITKPVGLDVDYANGYIYVTSIDTNTIFKINAVTNKIMNNITVGKRPYTVDIKPAGENKDDYKIYVSNLESNNVSIIDGNSFKLIKNIAVGENPVGLAANPNNNKVYVANRGSDTISIIDAVSDRVEKTLTVGDEPDGIDINLKKNTAYVTHTGSSTVSVIDGNTNEVVVSPIKVNNNISPELLELAQIQRQNLPPTIKFPNAASFADVNQETNMTYVANTGSSTVSVIDGNTNKLLVGLNLNINPLNSGTIKCVDIQNNNNSVNSTGPYIRVEYLKKFECTAYPKPGNVFDFWSGNLGGGSTTLSSTPWDQINFLISWFRGALSPQNSDPKHITVSEYDNVLIANFKGAPDYVDSLIIPFSIVAISGIYYVLRWIIRKITRYFNQKKYQDRYNKILEKADKEIVRNKEDAFQSLAQMRNEIRHDYYTGNLYYKTYGEIIKEIEEKLKELRGKLI